MNKTLYNFQEEALLNALIVLYYYYNKDHDKQKYLYRHFKYTLKEDKESINKTFEIYKNNIIKELQKIMW